MTHGKVKAIEVKRIIEALFVTAITSLCVGIVVTLLIVNRVSPICKYAKPVYNCNQYIIEPDKCQRIEGGTNTINVN